MPSFGGVHANRVLNDVLLDNGVEGFGAGIGIFAPAPGTASYDNVVSGNFAQGNGLGGIAVHSHAPGADVDGNAFVGNLIGRNNVTKSDGGDGSPISTRKTGIVLWSAVTPYHFTVARNAIVHDACGIWLTPATSR